MAPWESRRFRFPGHGSRCIFNEKKREPFERLNGFLRETRDTYSLVEIHTLCGEFSANAHEINSLATNNFQLLFVDPTGWTGFPPSAISKVIQGRNSELIVNFMQEHIARFLTSPTEAQQNGLNELIGEERASAMVGGYHSIQEIEQTYKAMMYEEFGFRFVASSPIYMENSDKLHFRLMYGTNHPAGIGLLRDVEVKSLKEHDDRKIAKKEDPAQANLFGEDDQKFGPYGRERQRHLQGLKGAILENLKGRGRNLSFQRLQADIQCENFVKATEIKDAVVELASEGLLEDTWKLRGSSKRKPDKDDRIYLIPR